MEANPIMHRGPVVPLRNVAGTWSLSATEAAPAEECFGLQQGVESVLGSDTRALIPSAKYAKGGSYHSIVKLQIKFQKMPQDDDRWAMATGWLIRDDIIVTAGHCAYDWGSGKLGKAVRVKAYIGYHGKAALKTDKNIQFRSVSRIVTTSTWLKDGKQEYADVAFFQVSRPFVGVVPFQFATTPEKAVANIGIVGYPADKKFFNAGKAEAGAQMWGAFAKISWNLKTSPQKTLDYNISTYPGQSGSPIIRQGTNTAIGVHVYGGSSVNSASTINGINGNNFRAYLCIFDAKIRASSTVRRNEGIDYVRLPPVKKVEADQEHQEGERDGGVGENGVEDVFEGGGMGETGDTEAAPKLPPNFGHALINGIQLVNGTVPTIETIRNWFKKKQESSTEGNDSPFAGDIGPAMSALVGGLVNPPVPTRVESVEDSEMTPTMFPSFYSALVSDAAFASVTKMSPAYLKKSGILARVKHYYEIKSKRTRKLSPRYAAVILEAALRMLKRRMMLKGLEAYEGSDESEALVPFPEAARVEVLESGYPAVENFIGDLLGPTKQIKNLETGSTELWFLLPAIIRTIVTVVPKIVKVASAARKKELSIGGILKPFFTPWWLSLIPGPKRKELTLESLVEAADGAVEAGEGDNEAGSEVGSEANGEVYGDEGEVPEVDEANDPVEADSGNAVEADTEALSEADGGQETNPVFKYINDLARRAILGEAALAALLQVHADSPKTPNGKRTTDMDLRAAMAYMKEHIQKFGPDLVSVVPAVLKGISLTPRLSDPAEDTGDAPVPPSPAPAKKKESSIEAILRDMGAGDDDPQEDGGSEAGGDGYGEAGGDGYGEAGADGDEFGDENDAEANDGEAFGQDAEADAGEADGGEADDRLEGRLRRAPKSLKPHVGRVNGSGRLHGGGGVTNGTRSVAFNPKGKTVHVRMTETLNADLPFIASIS